MMQFISGFLLSLSLCLDLGIVNVAVIKTGLERGFIPSFLMGFGSTVGDLVYAILSMVGISLILKYALIRWLLWIGGTLVLVYLSFHMLREALRPTRLQLLDAASRSDLPSLFQVFLTGTGLALSSPSAILWFATVGGSIIAATEHKGTDVSSLVEFFFGFFCAGFAWSGFVAFISGQARRRVEPRLLRLFSLLSAALFVFFAFRVFMNGINTLLL